MGVDRVLSAGRPAVLEAWADPNLSIIPQHISFEQAKNMPSALVKGDPNEFGIMMDSAKTAVLGMLRRKRECPRAIARRVRN